MKISITNKVILNDLRPTDDFWVLNYDGHHVFYDFSFKEPGEPLFYES